MVAWAGRSLGSHEEGLVQEGLVQILKVQPQAVATAWHVQLLLEVDLLHIQVLPQVDHLQVHEVWDPLHVQVHVQVLREVGDPLHVLEGPFQLQVLHVFGGLLHVLLDPFHLQVRGPSHVLHEVQVLFHVQVHFQDPFHVPFHVQPVPPLRRLQAAAALPSPHELAGAPATRMGQTPRPIGPSFFIRLILRRERGTNNS